MADITNQEALKIVRTEMRTLANLLGTAQRSMTQWMLRVVVLEGLISGNVNADTFADGGVANGQGVLTKLDVAEFKDAVESLLAAYAANNVGGRIFGIADNTRPAI